MRLLKKWLDFFLDGSFLLAIASVCLCGETYLLFGENVKSPGVLPLIFFSTLFIYNYRLLDSDIPTSLPKSFLKIFVLLIVFGMMASCVFVRAEILLFLLPFGMLAVAYNLPFIRLRGIPYLKIFLISLIWAVVTVMVPAKDMGADIFTSEIGFVFLRRVLFIFALAMPFDIRDTSKDRSRHIKTLPVLFGEKKSKLFALGALGIYCALVFFSPFPSGRVGNGLLLSAVVLAFLVLISSPSRSRYYYLILLDGTMILQFLLVWVVVRS